MSFIAGILTVLLVVNCLLLILLVLVQLPKKDAGAGMAFGGGAADALFGAGSGNVLTKITKWATGIFFGMCLILGMVQVERHITATRRRLNRRCNKNNRRCRSACRPAHPRRSQHRQEPIHLLCPQSRPTACLQRRRRNKPTF